jgi:hypothetical protein
MVNREGRDKLARALKELVDGDTTTDRFLLLKAEDEGDRAVRDIRLFASSLFDDIYPHRLKGEHAIPEPSQRVVDRCLLFLRTDVEYKWPPYPQGTVGFALFVISALCEVGAILLCYLQWTCPSIALLLVGIFGFVFHWVYRNRIETRKWEVFWSFGERDVWPFHSRKELQDAVVGTY